MKNFNKHVLNVQKDENGKVVAFSISRAYWGTGDEGGVLLDSTTGKMCCLGFYSLACDIPKERIVGLSYPFEIESTSYTKSRLFQTNWLKLSKKGIKDSIARFLGEINDAEQGVNRKIATKEAKISKIFADNGITVTFVD